ncbi:MAG TPA: cell wall hydrolase [Allosphingosinicella sp.]|nr:cell wall hydrolase [Allosphingosinicella sp.]
MFGSFRARVFALAASLFVVFWAGPAAAAAAASSPDVQALGSLTAPATVTTPAYPSTAAAVAPKVDAVATTMQRLPLHDLIISFVDYKNQSAEEMCLAKAVYFEARGESIEGQLAVAQVVLNRAASGTYPPTICGVVTQPAQFSFVHGGAMPAPDTSSECWHKALAIADIAMKHLATSLASNVLWYHATYVAPAWGRQHLRVAQIGMHIFYS